MKAGTKLEKVLQSGKFAVTAEISLPRGASAEKVQKDGEAIRKQVDAVNLPDNASASVGLASLAGCILLKQKEIEPVFQITCRDRNRIALQSDVLGAVALGIGNILCLSGDHPSLGNHSGAKGVFDIDSVQLIQALKSMRDQKKFISGEDVSGEVPIFIGAVENPFADPQEARVARLAKKIKAGADFIQTQAVADIEGFGKWMKEVVTRGLDQQTHIIAGIPAADGSEESVKKAVEMIQRVKSIPGVHGIHITGADRAETIAILIERAGLTPRPAF